MNRSSRIQAVSFDVGGTLIDPWPSVGHVYAGVAREFGLSECLPEVLNSRFMSAWQTKQNFEYTRLAWAELVATTFDGLNVRDVDRLFDRLYDRFVEADVWKVYEDVLGTLQTLRDRGLKLAIVSNWDERLRPLLRNLKLDSHFDAMVVSAEIGFHKPAPPIFRKLVGDLGIRAEHILHVGDSWREDLQGARDAGLKGLLIRRSAGAQTADEIGSLTAVPALLQRGLL